LSSSKKKRSDSGSSKNGSINGQTYNPSTLILQKAASVSNLDAIKIASSSQINFLTTELDFEEDYHKIASD
jgi:hypothetical protein